MYALAANVGHGEGHEPPPLRLPRALRPAGERPLEGKVAGVYWKVGHGVGWGVGRCSMPVHHITPALALLLPLMQPPRTRTVPHPRLRTHHFSVV